MTNEIDKHFITYLQREGKMDVDNIASLISKAIADGNYDYIKSLMKQFKVNDIMQLANKVIKIKAEVETEEPKIITVRFKKGQDMGNGVYLKDMKVGDVIIIGD
jgi:hypothetical protein